MKGCTDTVTELQLFIVRIWIRQLRDKFGADYKYENSAIKKLDSSGISQKRHRK